MLENAMHNSVHLFRISIQLLTVRWDAMNRAEYIKTLIYSLNILLNIMTLLFLGPFNISSLTCIFLPQITSFLTSLKLYKIRLFV